MDRRHLRVKWPSNLPIILLIQGLLCKVWLSSLKNIIAIGISLFVKARIEYLHHSIVPEGLQVVGWPIVPVYIFKTRNSRPPWCSIPLPTWRKANMLLVAYCTNDDTIFHGCLAWVRTLDTTRKTHVFSSIDASRCELICSFDPGNVHLFLDRVRGIAGF